MEGSQAGAGAGQLLYLVQVGAVDLTLAASDNNRFEPMAYDDSVSDAELAANPVLAYRGTLAQKNSGTTADFCQGLITGAAAAAGSGQAVVGGASESPVAVAYALVHPARAMPMAMATPLTASMPARPMRSSGRSTAPGCRAMTIRCWCATSTAWR
jgi:hypothetical protein